MSPSLSRRERRRARHAIGMAGIGLFVASVAWAQQTKPDPAGGLGMSDLRLGASDDLSGELRRSDAVSRQPLAPSVDQTLDEPFGRGSKKKRDRPNDVDASAADEDADDPKPEADAPDFDLFEGPDGAPASPANVAIAPAAAGGAVAGPAAPAARKSAAADADPLQSAQRRSIRTLDLAVPVAGRSQRAEPIGGRLNLPITGLRPAVPLSVDDAFAPVGIRAGSFVLYSTLDQSLGVSSNLSRSPRGVSGAFSDTQLSGRLLSNWSLHELEVNGLAAYRRNFAGEVESEPRLALDGRLRLDVDRLTTATLTGAVEYRKEDPVDLSAYQLSSERPDILTYSAGAEVARAFGRTKLALTTTAIRETTSDVSPPGVVTLGENYTTATAALRAGYEISPALQPFVAGSVGRRVFDEELDLSGTERDSVISSLRSGVTFDLGEKLLGEVAVGYAWNVPDADGLETVSSPTVDARIAWSPQRGTDVVVSAATKFDPDATLASTSTLYEGAISLRHRATARTDITAALTASYRDSDLATDREKTYGAETGFTYWLNRSLALTGLLHHERLDSEAPNGDYTANSARIGLRMQR